jgi:hypothetical protein
VEGAGGRQLIVAARKARIVVLKCQTKIQIQILKLAIQ